MKVKHFLSGATLLSAALLLNAPLSAAVESDTVGYTTITMEAGKWYQIGNPFVALEDGVGESVNELLPNGFADGDVAYVFDTKRGLYGSTYKWDANGKEGAGWYTGGPFSSSLAVDPLPVGGVLFIHKENAGTVATLKGRVQEGVEVKIGKAEGDGWTQAVCVFPKEVSINDMNWEGMEEGDKLYIFDPTTDLYETYTWDTVNNQTGWCSGGPFSQTFSNRKVSIGQGLFVNKKSAGEGLLSYGN